MSQLPQPKLEFIGNGKARVLEPIKHKYGEVAAGFVTDGFSVPRFLWWFHNPFGDGLLAAIIHDDELRKRNPHAHQYFREYLQLGGVSKFKAHIMYFFVLGYQKVKYPNAFKDHTYGQGSVK
ncbi:DUF1353 domain-containing protein [Pseudoalteromonas piscicida]|uniref:DUF1353 domain-containing protein n=1 Tax=Pseudoalteromonas piscicida TaxID=43662 RepID=UPI0027383924|nr:DUF1353 domain-containing protein [Pseudoalteromonas piscicida]MDP4487258.1 DUF1353 domain-containing protein [Pseudoalteromonas piscicida]